MNMQSAEKNETVDVLMRKKLEKLMKNMRKFA